MALELKHIASTKLALYIANSVTFTLIVISNKEERLGYKVYNVQVY